MKKQMLKKLTSILAVVAAFSCGVFTAFADVLQPVTGGSNHKWIWVVVLAVAIVALVAVVVALVFNNRKKSQNNEDDAQNKDE